METEVVITRSKLYAPPGKNCKFGWQYSYDVHVPDYPHNDGVMAGYDRKDTAHRIARREARRLGCKVREDFFEEAA